MRKTVLIHTQHAWRSHRTKAAFNNSHGLQICTIEQLAARLAGGFLQPIDPDDLNTAVDKALSSSQGELDAIKTLLGFRRAAATTLSKLWLAGLDLDQELAAAIEASVRDRFKAFIALERQVIKDLPPNQYRPGDLADLAIKRVQVLSQRFRWAQSAPLILKLSSQGVKDFCRGSAKIGLIFQLAFSNHPDNLNAAERHAGRMKLFKSEHWPHDPLD